MNMLLDSSFKLGYNDVLLRPKRSALGSRKEVNIHRELKFKHSQHTFEGLPIIASNMDGVGTFKMAQTLSKYKMLTALTKHLEIDDLINHFKKDNQYTIYSLGIKDEDFQKFKAVNQAVTIKWVCIDVANGYSERFIDFVANFRQEFPDKIIIAGNVATSDITEELILKGADIVKVGIGPGSACTTRIVTGIGVPQLSAVIECADAAHGLGGLIIADGGCNTTGDIVKAFAGGGDFVMLGGFLAGTDQSQKEVIEKKFITSQVDNNNQIIYETKKFIQFYGMSSETANKKYSGGIKDYKTSEGREVLVDYKGSVDKIVQQIIGGLRSACTYVGAINLKVLPRCATFVRCNNTHNKILE